MLHVLSGISNQVVASDFIECRPTFSVRNVNVASLNGSMLPGLLLLYMYL